MDEYGKEYFEQIYDASGEGKIISQKRGEMLLVKIPNVKRVLDVGCGYGDFINNLEDQGLDVDGVDISKHALKEARRKVSRELYKVDVASEDLPYKDEMFDVVTIFDVIEHLVSSRHLFEEVKRVLRPGGMLFCTTPNNQGIIRDFLVKIFPDDPTHVNVQRSRYWRERLQEVGFLNIEFKYCLLHGFPPLPGLRRFFMKRKLPVYIGPIFSPSDVLSGTLYIWGRKS